MPELSAQDELELAEGAIQRYEEAAATYREAVVGRDAAVATRALAKATLIANLIGQHNPDTGKAHSRTSAEKFVGETSELLDHDERVAEAERVVAAAEVTMKAAYLRAQLAVRAVGV